MWAFLCILGLVFSASDVDSSRILGIFPMASVSHQVVFRALTYELAKRGHELVVITPDPGLPKDRPKDNITEIDISHGYEGFKTLMAKGNPKRGVVITPHDMLKLNKFKVILNCAEEVMKNEELNKILNDDTKKFDLVIGEALYNFPMIYAKRFDTPMIWFSSFFGIGSNFQTLGAASGHPFLYPVYFRDRYLNLTLIEKIQQLYIDVVLRLGAVAMSYYEHGLMKQYFGDETPSLDELRDRIDLMFINTNQVFETARPVPPNVIYLGGLHMKPVQPLPKDLKQYLDSSERGVVYVSLGTNVRIAEMDATLLKEFVKAFDKMPYDVLWKYDGIELPWLPKNIKHSKWFPQRDLLHHPNIKAFVTQGGLQSTDEAIDAGVPLVGLPALADQWYNVERYVKHGIGKQLDLVTMRAEDLVAAVMDVVEDESYRENIQKLSKLVKDQPETPLERAVWWTEYVIRNKGAKHLRSPSFNISWSEFLMLDVVLALCGISLLVFVIFVTIVLFLVRKCKLCKTDVKKDTKKVKKN
ncbi:UDP-glucosyltransferase 2 [Plutella xylostella]|uniref:UDP-glucosyltransferase 2 n=1 Tax=Plutella xylostella TaxID=51655 RepID=UPI00203250DA|nr:UDP-glucosyltransferase 2 [Plutella xylostella]